VKKAFIRILLLAVLLNLGDWPYVDEIFGSAGPVSELLGAHSRAPLPQHPGAASHAQQGYQILLGMQALPQSPWRLEASAREKVASFDVRPARYLIPPRIDRPPIPAALS
jgi:hypothetical protein